MASVPPDPTRPDGGRTPPAVDVARYRWFRPSPNARLTAAELAAWAAEVVAWPAGHAARVTELGTIVRCPCCDRTVDVEDLIAHVEQADADFDSSCDRIRWGAFYEDDYLHVREARELGCIELRPFVDTAPQRVSDLEVEVEDLQQLLYAFACRLAGRADVDAVYRQALGDRTGMPPAALAGAEPLAAYNLGRVDDDWWLVDRLLGVAEQLEDLVGEWQRLADSDPAMSAFGGHADDVLIHVADYLDRVVHSRRVEPDADVAALRRRIGRPRTPSTAE